MTENEENINQTGVLVISEHSSLNGEVASLGSTKYLFWMQYMYSSLIMMNSCEYGSPVEGIRSTLLIMALL